MNTRSEGAACDKTLRMRQFSALSTSFEIGIYILYEIQLIFTLCQSILPNLLHYVTNHL